MGSTTPTTESLPYWQINVPPALRTTTCPPYLLDLSPKDLSIISTPDSIYTPLIWPSVVAIIQTNDLSAFQRLPSQLRKYLSYTHTLKSKYGSIMTFILQERLRWQEPVRPTGKPFEKEEDVKILCNDWPYGLDARIVHLVVWTKFELVDDVRTGDLSEEARGEIEVYVSKVFRSRCGDENVIWFKNWSSLKSVRAVEHFHVMLFNPEPGFIKEITNGDIPLNQKV